MAQYSYEEDPESIMGRINFLCSGNTEINEDRRERIGEGIELLEEKIGG